MKMGTIVSLWHYDGAASPRAPIDKSAMACDLALRLMLGSVPDFARSSDYPATGALSIDSVIDAMGHLRKPKNTPPSVRHSVNSGHRVLFGPALHDLFGRDVPLRGKL